MLCNRPVGAAVNLLFITRFGTEANLSLLRCAKLVIPLYVSEYIHAGTCSADTLNLMTWMTDRDRHLYNPTVPSILDKFIES